MIIVPRINIMGCRIISDPPRETIVPISSMLGMIGISIVPLITSGAASPPSFVMIVTTSSIWLYWGMVTRGSTPSMDLGNPCVPVDSL